MSPPFCFPVACAAILITTGAWWYYYSSPNHGRRDQLPRDLRTWRLANEEATWSILSPILALNGWKSWDTPYSLFQDRPEHSISNGFHTGGSYRYMSPYAITKLKKFHYHNAFVRAVRNKEGYDAVCRVIVAGNEGQNCLKAIRRVAYGDATHFCDSHVLPLLFEFQFEDITFGIFPLMSGMNFHDMIPSIYCHCSLGDFMHMLTQALEALQFIHHKRVAHHDAFFNNFLVEWQPDSLKRGAISVAHPRVWLIDFENAMSFPEDTPYGECKCTTPDFLKRDNYGRPYDAAFMGDLSFNAFTLDLWQFMYYAQYLEIDIPTLNEVLRNLQNQSTAESALRLLHDTLCTFTPSQLHVPFRYTEPSYDCTED
ncbi:hypothetical protein GGU10DRAFT_360987 [Lentinula aff. detonsa]|uniref:Protein kinase domain-containing protein n=1 Tax=Lentinula aff. detonsa TaxID=2804958 RepID=A0AA38KQM4_9AGAR|nr:hypothetical protein GGU10DRAFT_360987 [Lentinula aff. detonsa]